MQIMEDNRELVARLVELLVETKVVRREEFRKLVEEHGHLEQRPPDIIEIRNRNLEEFREQIIAGKRIAELPS
jgi:hypothetical protein